MNPTTVTTRITAAGASLAAGDGQPARRSPGRSLGDWLFAALALCGTLFALWRYAGVMDGYETVILLGTLPIVIALGWFWQPLRTLMLVSAAANADRKSVV